MNLARVGDLAEQVRGLSYVKTDAVATPASGRTPVLRAGNIVGSSLTMDDLVYLPTEQVAERQKLRAGDVLIATSSGSLDVVGKAGSVSESSSATFGAFCKVLRPGNRVDARYFAHYFQTQDYRRTVSALAAGANINNLRNRDLDNLEIPVPPIEEQRRIAAILDQAEALRAKRRESLTQIDNLIRATFVDEMSPRNSTRWPILTIADVASPTRASIRTGPFGSQLLHSEFTEAGVPVLGIDNAVANEFRWGKPRFISAEKYQKLKRYTVTPGDVLVTIMGTCGRCAVIPAGIPTAINTKHLCCITSDPATCLPDFLHASFLWQPVSRNFLKRAAKGAVMDGLNMGLIKETPLVVPPILVQTRIVQRLSDLRRQLTKVERMLSETDALFESLQARAFTGRL